jgi:predicted alpha/beta hydrolase
MFLYSGVLGFYVRSACQLKEAYGDGVMRVQHVRNWCRFPKFAKDVYDDDRNGQLGTSEKDVGEMRVKELILEYR